MRKQKSSEGFTLVELIVVIAILGILAGAGTVAYTGYVQRAQKSTDQQNVANLIYAAQLADYADSSLFGDDGSGLVIITDDGASAYGTYGDYASALENGVGSLSSMSLSYGGYSTSASTYSTMLSNVAELSTYTSGTDSEGNAVTYSIGYADAASDLWDEIKTMVGSSGSIVSTSDEDKASAVLLTAYATAEYSTMDNMATAWGSGKAYPDEFSTSLYNAANGGGVTAGDMAVAYQLALPAARKAYNEAFAIYLAANYSYSGIDDDVEKLKNEYSSVLVSTSASMPSGNSEYATAVSAYLGAQAKLDGAAYYQMMYTINQTYGTGTDTDGSTTEFTGDESLKVSDADAFWTETSAYVASISSAYKNYNNIAEMQAALENVDGNVAVILATKSGGVLKFKVSPNELDVQESSSDGDEAETSYDTELTLVFKSNEWYNETVTEKISTQSVTLSSRNNSYNECTVNTYANSAGAGGIPLTTIYSSSDESVATVSGSDGTYTIKAVGSGTATVTLSYPKRDNTYTVTINVTVK